MVSAHLSRNATNPELAQPLAALTQIHPAKQRYKPGMGAKILEKK